MKSLVIFLSLVFSTSLYAAEPVTLPDGRTGIFIESDKAKKLLEAVEVELPALRKENELLKREIELYKNLENIAEMKMKNEEQIANKWKQNYELTLKRTSELEAKDDFRFYIDVGIFVFGTLTGGGAMYLSSLLVANTIK
jgi:hypothetical protein